MDKSDSDGFFSKRLGCRTNDRSYNSTDSSLITVDSERFLAFLCSAADHVRDDHATYYVIPCPRDGEFTLVWKSAQNYQEYIVSP